MHIGSIVFDALRSTLIDSFLKELEAIDAKLDLSELPGKLIETL